MRRFAGGLLVFLTMFPALAQVPVAKVPPAPSQIAVLPQAIKPGTSAPTPAHSPRPGGPYRIFRRHFFLSSLSEMTSQAHQCW